MGPANDEMVETVADLLKSAGEPYRFIATHEMPGTVRFGFGLPGPSGGFSFPDGTVLPTDDIKAIYHRVGFSDFEVGPDYDPVETQFVNAECVTTLNGYLNCTPALVVNRPVASGSNASKPFQISLVQNYGFEVPITLVTSLPESAREFYETLGGKVIYKSISFTRSIVQRMTAEDLDRLEMVRTCPVQFQEAVEGNDIRVHVVGNQVFPSLITAEESDYRYDKKSVVMATELPEDVERRCVEMTRALGFVMSGIDLRVTPEGKYYCFEVNPSPAFSWYQNRTEQPITEALCDLLIRANNGEVLDFP